MASSTVSLALLLVFFMFSFSEAKEFLVGSWEVSSSEPDRLNKWAESSRFQVGDYLVWKYDGKKESVLQVSRGDYLNCNTKSPIEEHKDGNTTVRLDRSGPFYFISGADGHCQKGQRLIVVVMSHRARSGFMGVTPAPSPMEMDGPAVAPTSGALGLKRDGYCLVVLASLLGLLLV
ncbi:hypothetical protein Syun_010904 [Stephania yunnanensis]|uniref:Phytocyanin domain-containing protein n=1 Tax=Stephania yunnanensis TaxID=152371 RepID=A0AAP0PG06_9MAGN